MPDPVLDLVTARRWAVTARLMLGAARERIDGLNVFPVADGDTGTNMFLTFDGALEHLRVQFEIAGTDRLQEGLALIARGMLLGARGNSGVILAQLARGLADAVGPEVDVAGPAEVAAAFEASARTAWGAVAEPVEGTILTVARAAGDGARSAVDAGAPDVAEVVDAAHAAAEAALARTPEQLPELRAAGVVDAGGAGLLLVIEALQAVLRERAPGAEAELPEWWGTAAEHHHDHADASGAPGEQAVEVMYLLTESDPERAERLRTHLTHLGDSVAVAGGPTDYQVHVHLHEPAAAVEAGSLAGVVSAVRHTSLTDGHLHEPPPTGAVPTGVGVVACGLGEGVVGLFAEAGAVVVPSGPRRRASAGQLLAAIRACDSGAVIVLPNDEDTVMVARAAAAEAVAEGLAVEVVPTRTLLEGMASLAVHDPDGTASEVASAMVEAAAGVRGGAVTRADRAVDTPVGPCREGQWLGIVDHAIVAVSDDLSPAADVVLDTIWLPGAELVTVLLGADATEPVEAAFSRALERRTAGSVVEVTSLVGGQPTYPVLVGVE